MKPSEPRLLPPAEQLQREEDLAARWPDPWHDRRREKARLRVQAWRALGIVLCLFWIGCVLVVLEVSSSLDPVPVEDHEQPVAP